MLKGVSNLPDYPIPDQFMQVFEQNPNPNPNPNPDPNANPNPNPNPNPN